MPPARRRWLQRAALGGLGLGALPGLLAGCDRDDPLRVGAHPFPSYGFLFMARARGWLDESQVRLVETPSAGASIRALGAGALEAACLTLDEVLATRESGVPLVVVAVLNMSLGADALMVRPRIRALGDLRGRVVGVEPSTTGAVMLDAVLRAAGLARSAVTVRHVAGDDHVEAFSAGTLDAVVSYAPHLSRLAQRGAVRLFSSVEVPGRIVDVLAVRRPLLDDRPDTLRHLVQAHFQALEAFRGGAGADAALARRLGVGVGELAAQFDGLALQDRAANRAWLGGRTGRLHGSAEAVGAAMQDAGLLRGAPALGGLVDGRFTDA